MPAVIFSGDSVKALKNRLKLKNDVQIISGDPTPTSTAVDAPKGSIYLQENGKLYIKQDDGLTTNWKGDLGQAKDKTDDLTITSPKNIDILNGKVDTALTWIGDEAKYSWGSAIGTPWGTWTSAPRGTLSNVGLNELRGISSWRHVQHATSQLINEWIRSDSKRIARKFKGRICSLKFAYSYNGNDDDFSVVVHDATNTTILTTGALKATGTLVGDMELFFTVPENCSYLEFGLNLDVVNASKELIVDDIEIALVSTREKDLFGIRVFNEDGTDPYIVSQSYPYNPAVASISRVAAGVTDVFFTPGFFDLIPVVQAAFEWNSLGWAATIDPPTTSSVRIYTVANKDIGPANYNFTANITRQ